jgi:hypothetical protein
LCGNTKCAKIFVTYRRDKLYCCPECQKKAHDWRKYRKKKEKIIKIIPCVRCGKFIDSKNNKKFCQVCIKKRINERNLEYQKRVKEVNKELFECLLNNTSTILNELVGGNKNFYEKN